MLEICGLDKTDIEEHFTEDVGQVTPWLLRLSSLMKMNKRLIWYA